MKELILRFRLLKNSFFEYLLHIIYSFLPVTLSSPHRLSKMISHLLPQSYMFGLFSFSLPLSFKF